MDTDMDSGSRMGNAMPMETRQANGDSVAMNIPEMSTSPGQSHPPYVSEPPNKLSAGANISDSRASVFSLDRTAIPLASDPPAPQGDEHLPCFLPDPVPVNPIPTRRMEWMPDFTFGPASEPIDISAFLASVQETLGSERNSQQSEGDFRDWLRPEHVAGWSDLQALGLEERMMLQEACSVSDLLTSLTDITSDPAQLNLVKEMHNQSTLAALGHTTESIKLPPEKRDRKRKVSGKVGVRSGDVPNNEASGGQQNDDDPGRGAQEEGSWVPDEIGALHSDVRGVAGDAKAHVSPSTTIPETTLGAIPAPTTAHSRGGRNRKGKAPADAGETVSGEWI
ncbi:unnamed protein product [Rhizoctonia solani]|uniref:Uncharacterized protein n=1 Tax=Rhizoctonia solani TaxID=456999 RepID=A0A8H3B3W0_9AGAM|nr:unnamed protein product [Rhizoctonia solani]